MNDAPSVPPVAGRRLSGAPPVTVPAASRPLLAEVFPPGALAAAVEADLVKRVLHPELPLTLYSYTRKTQFGHHWDQVTVRCRGLIVDEATGRIAAHCLPKFFAARMHELGYGFASPLPEEPFEVFDKEDGSLGILFHHAGRWHAATKGAFVSRQAAWAREWLDVRDTTVLDPAVTYLAEIIHPGNRIVVGYGEEYTLVLLAAIGPDGVEQPLAAHAPTWIGLGGRVVRTRRAESLAAVMAAAEADRDLDGASLSGTAVEGWVVRYASGVRVKVKTVDYLRLHGLLTGVTERDVWRVAGLRRLAAESDPREVARVLGGSADEAAAITRSGHDPFEDFLDAVPDEFDAWVRGIATRLTAEADECERQAREVFAELAGLHGDRGGFARAVKARSARQRHLAEVLFRLFDGRDIAPVVWRHIRPGPSRPFRVDDAS